MWAKFQNFSHSIFFLIIGICFTLQVAFWQTTDLVWMTMIVSFLAIPLLDSLAGLRKFPSLASFGTFAHWVPRLYFLLHFYKILRVQKIGGIFFPVFMEKKVEFSLGSFFFSYHCSVVKSNPIALD